MPNERTIILSDLHCGHYAGLHTPKFQRGGGGQIAAQDKKWKWFESALVEASPFDKAVWVGDLVDGGGVKNSSERVLNLNEQIDCARDIIKTVGCKKNLFVYGTMVHTSTRDGLELEDEIAKRTNGEDEPLIFSQAWFKIGKHIVDVRHAPACSSAVPNTRANPILRERMANEQWSMKGLQPLADLYLRGHLHYKFTAGSPGTWQGWNLAALQTPNTKFGRRLSNTVDVGFSLIEANDKWPIYEIYEAPICREEVLNW
jgi:hypothetical protein